MEHERHVKRTFSSLIVVARCKIGPGNVSKAILMKYGQIRATEDNISIVEAARRHLHELER